MTRFQVPRRPARMRRNRTRPSRVRHARVRPGRTATSAPLLALVALLLAPAARLDAQRPEPKIHGEFDGDPMYTVLPPDAIPAIRTPEFLTGTEAGAQMSPDEPVIGVVIGGKARAYSTWHLDAHEIVNDTIAGRPIAVTW